MNKPMNPPSQMLRRTSKIDLPAVPTAQVEQLIEKLCPQGVVFRALGEVAKLINGRAYKQNELLAEGPTPVLRVGNFFSNREWYYSDLNLPEDKYCHKGDLLYAWSASFGPRIWEGEKAIFHYHIWKIEISNEVDKTFLYYLLDDVTENIKAKAGRGATMVHITKGDMEKRKIPIPPLALQKEIVKILDTFTRLEAELEAELEARKKQYEYYREQLLMVNDEGLMVDGTEVEFRALGEVGKVSMCKRIFKNQTSTTGQIPFYKIGTFGNTPNAFISQEIYDEYRRKFSFPKKGDVLLSASGTIGRRVIYDGEPAYFQDSNIIWIDNDESKVLNKFLYYLYSIVIWQTEGGTIKRLYNDNLKKIKIPIPPLSKQKEIVAILDKFDALVNDISTGLPAEIAARKKQYEYYRNQLLSFKPVGANGSSPVPTDKP